MLIEIAIELEPEIADYFLRVTEEAREEQIDAGVQFIKFSDPDAKWFIDLAYSSGWEDMKKRISEEDYLKLRKLLKGE